MYVCMYVCMYDHKVGTRRALELCSMLYAYGEESFHAQVHIQHSRLYIGVGMGNGGIEA